MAGVEHRTLVDDELHPAGYVQASDPGAVGAARLWVDTSGGDGLWVLKIRNAADDGWEAISTFGDPSGGDYVKASGDGIRAFGDATMWDDLRFAAVSTKLGGSKDPGFAVFLTNGSGSQGVFVYWFDKATEEELFFAAQMPHSWKEGSDIEVHTHWVGKTTAGGAGTDVCWGLEYTWVNINGTFGNTTIIYGDEQSNGAAETITANKHYLTELGTISGSGKTLSSMLICRVFRDATGAGGTDDYDADAGLLEIDFHYQVDGLGSEEEYVKE